MWPREPRTSSAESSASAKDAAVADADKEIERDPYGKLFEDADKRWQEVQCDTDPDINPAPLPDAEHEAPRHVFHGKESPGNLPSEMMRPLFPTTALMQLGLLSENVSRLESFHAGAPQRAMAPVDIPRPSNRREFIRGNPDRLGEEVPRQFLTILAGDTQEPFTHGSGRLDLA